jgi:hypothetical protein
MKIFKPPVALRRLTVFFSCGYLAFLHIITMAAASILAEGPCLAIAVVYLVAIITEELYKRLMSAKEGLV